MRFAEVFLRLGASLVGWMIIIAYLLWLAVTPRLDCAVSGDELYRLLVFFGPPAAILGSMILATSPMQEIQAILRWLAVLPALLLPFALLAIAGAASQVHVSGMPLCNEGSMPGWQLAFTPVVLASLAGMAWACLRVWQTTRSEQSADR